MRATTTLRSERIELRTNTEVKSLIERAAQIRHTTISAYLLDSALQKAKEDIRDTETLILGEVDRELFFSALVKPPEPNAALRRLLLDSSREKA
ncbi:MAG: hypothetical protein A2Y38_06520 [Spirochaetes bacterium GWB1_59_5]|nr:MAG: hypothetical protein A2Y38_06520 [Spirochaetes bacterium GWB1_59_5]